MNKKIAVIVIILLLLTITSVQATWCNNNFAKRIDINVNNTAGAALTDYQVYLNLSTNPINETSLRVYNSSDCTLRSHWTENETDGNSYGIWINYSAVAASAWTNNTAIYYDNAAASSASNGENTFEFFDDFEGIILVNEPTNPTRTPDGGWEGTALCEQSDFNYSGEYISWYRGGLIGDYYNVGYENSSNTITWTPYTGNPILDQNGGGPFAFPYVVKDGDCFYMFTVNGNPGTNMYLYNVTNHTNPVIMNGGNPVYTHSTTSSDWDYHIFNPAVEIVDGTWHMLLEGSASTGKNKIGYSYSNLTEMNWTAHRTTTHVVADAGNPYLVHVPDRNALLTLQGDKTGTYWKIISYYANVSDDLTSSSSWHLSPNFEISKSSIHIADPHAMFNFNATYPTMISYNYDQIETWQVYSVLSLNGFYDEVTTDILSKWNNTEGLTTSISDGILSVSASNQDKSMYSNNSYSYSTAIRTLAKWSTFASATYGGCGYISATDEIDITPTESGNNGYVNFKKAGSASGVQSLGLVSGNVTNYHIWDVLRLNDSVVIKNDGVTKLTYTNTAYIPTVSIPVSIHSYSSGLTGYYDYFLVRKYTSPDPSSTLGNEEQQGANPTLHIGNAINIQEDWGRNFNSNLSANVTGANASGVWMNFTNAEFTNTSLGNLNLTLDEWVNESHNVNSPVTNVSVDVYLNSTILGATNDTDSFYYEITKRTNTATMDSSATQNVDTSETFYVNATCNEEYGDTFLGAANLLEDGAIIDTNSSVTNYVNFSHSESSEGVYNYTIRFYNLTHYDNTTTPTYSNVTVSAGEYIPPDTNNPQNTTGNFWINHTWTCGLGEPTGNKTDSFNVSVNTIWYNTTTTTYYNDTGLSAHNWSNITVWAYNISGTGSLSVGNTSDDVRIPNNPITLTVTQNYNKIETETVFISDTSSSDADSDTPTYSCNRTDLFIDFSSVTGYGNWTTGITDSGVYHVDLGVCDGWGSTDNKTLTITISDATPGTPANLANTTGNFWVNHTWTGGSNTDTFNVSVNLSWNNGSSNEYFNNTPLSAHVWSNISVHGFNSTSGELSSNISQNTQIPNNLPVLNGLPDNTTDEDVNQTDIFDLDSYFTDADGDTPTYLVESNNQSAYVSVTINASNNVSYTLASGWNGTASVVINVTDGWGGEDNDTFLIIVNAPPLPGDYTPGDPTGLGNTTGNYWVNYTWNVGGGNVTDSYNVSWNLTWYNTTTDTFMKKEVGASNWANITVYAYNSSGNGTLSSSYLSDNVQAPAYVPGDYEPPNPTTLQNTTGNYYVNYTWVMGVPGNITDSYNVSWNSSWYNNTLTAYMQKEVGASNWGNITVYAFNSSGNGSLSAGYITDNVQAPAYVPGDYPPATPTTLANTTGNGWVNYTWASGGGANTTDSYNVSWNLTWYNTTLVAYMNDSVGEFGWANISVWAYNSSGNGSLSVGSISDDTQAGGGTYITSMITTVYNLITYYGSSASTAEQFGIDIGSVDYIALYNGSFYTHTMGHIGHNFTTYHGIGYYVYLNASGSTTYNRANISDSPYNTQLFNRWNTVGWTNATDTNAEGVASSIGSACKYTSTLNADGVTYTTHTVGFASNNHVVEKGKGYWVWVNTGVSWGRNS